MIFRPLSPPSCPGSSTPCRLCRVGVEHSFTEASLSYCKALNKICLLPLTGVQLFSLSHSSQPVTMISDMSKIQPFSLEVAQDVNLQCLSPCMIPGELKQSRVPQSMRDPWRVEAERSPRRWEHFCSATASLSGGFLQAECSNKHPPSLSGLTPQGFLSCSHHSLRRDGEALSCVVI